MTSPQVNFSVETSHPALAHFVNAHIDAAHFVPQTGLVILALFKQHRFLLAIGVGPITTRVGLLPQLPIARTKSEHPLLSTLRAHVVGSSIRNILIEDDAIWITSEPIVPNQSPEFPTRLALFPGRHGKIRMIPPNGSILEWPVSTNLVQTSITDFDLQHLEKMGEELLQISNDFCIESLRRDLLTIIRKRCIRLERRISAVREDLARLDDVPRLQKIGSLLLSQAQNIPRGSKKTKLIDWETNEQIEVDLAPDKPVQTQATEFFQQARRLQRGAEIMHERLEETMRARQALEPWKQTLQDAPADWNVLQEIAQKLQEAGLIAPSVSAVLPPKQLDKDERKPHHTFYSTNGRQIWVGKSGPDNDELVTRLAKPHHLWLHAKNIPGAHVIVPLDKQHSCPPDVLVDAATLAAHFSNARNESTCEVSYVEKRHVRKPKKSAPGNVIVQHEKVIVVRIEKNRLSRLLRSKLETR